LKGEESSHTFISIIEIKCFRGELGMAEAKKKKKYYGKKEKKAKEVKKKGCCE